MSAESELLSNRSKDEAQLTHPLAATTATATVQLLLVTRDSPRGK